MAKCEWGKDVMLALWFPGIMSPCGCFLEGKLPVAARKDGKRHWLEQRRDNGRTLRASSRFWTYAGKPPSM